MLRQLEERLLAPDVRGSPAAADARLGDDFVEFGSSGTVYDKASILAALQEEPRAWRSSGAPVTGKCGRCPPRPRSSYIGSSAG
jgi:Domain of unknown function (DUF4440)